MCRFKSGLILENKVMLTPIYNESHSTMLDKCGIEDTDFNARKVFIRAELIPYEGDFMSDISKWKYIVDQDVTPDWYEEDPEKYEEMFRKEVEAWRDKNIIMICGQPCTKLKEENGNTYYHLCKPLFESEFGTDNNYANSAVRKKLLEHEFTLGLQKEYGDRLVPAVMDLTALDGLKDYGKVTDIIGIPDLNLYRECRENILAGDRWWWLSTPNSTPSGTGSSGVRFVRSNGYVDWNQCDWNGGVRPFFILKS